MPIGTSDSPTSPEREHLGRLALASGVGTSLEFYDFAVYGTATALVFNKIFFVSDDPWFGAFVGFAGFAVGVLVAPLGAILFGNIGDRLGRKRALVITFLLMGAATLAMGLLPDYYAIGVAAPILLVVLRMIHGLSRGGEVGGAALLAVEHAPPLRRGLYGSFVTLGSPIGALLANLSFTLVLLMPMEDVVAWGWRIPFIAGGLVLVVGIWARRNVSETPVFQELATSRESLERSPFVRVVRENWRRILLAAGAHLGVNANMFILFTFLLSYASEPAPNGLGLARSSLVNGSLIGIAAHAVAIVISCRLTDRLGRKPVMLVGAVACFVYAYFLFVLVDTGRMGVVVGAMAVGFFLTGILYGPILTYFTELFSPQLRYSGVGLGYQLGAVLGGGLSPMVANRLVAITGTSMSVSFYLMALLAVTIACLIALPETAPVKVGVAEEDMEKVCSATLARGGDDPVALR